MQVSAKDPSKFIRERRPALPSLEPVRRPPQLTPTPDNVRKVEHSRSDVPRRPADGVEQSRPDVSRRPADGVEQSRTNLPRGPADGYYDVIALPCDAGAVEPLVENKPVERPQLKTGVAPFCLRAARGAPVPDQHERSGRTDRADDESVLKLYAAPAKAARQRLKNRQAREKEKW